MAKKIIETKLYIRDGKRFKKENAIIIWLAMNAFCGIIMLCNKNCAFHFWSIPFFMNCCTIIWRGLSIPEKL